VRAEGRRLARGIPPVPQRMEVHPLSGSLHGMESRLARVLALGQGVFYVLTGPWALARARA